MNIRIVQGDIHLIDLRTRLPFKYGIATMTSAPHAFVRVFLEVDGQSSCGIAADHLPPKWFTKVPDQPLDREVDEMLRVIEHAVLAASGLEAATAFDLYRELSELQAMWGRAEDYPALLSQFGTSLVERAVIEAVCRARQAPFAQLVRENVFGIRLEQFDERLKGFQPADLLPDTPLSRTIARHTVGMADPLDESEISDEERLDDGLPQSLAACLRQYGLVHFKVKVRGELQHDVERLSQIAAVVATHVGPKFSFTMDGNEQFRSLDDFRDFWNAISRTEKLASFMEHLLFVEQPFHRDVALDPDTLGKMPQWTERPGMIIDESDAHWDSLPQAIQLGYHGTSHKNCKGVFKSIANACLLEWLQRRTENERFVLSGEDLVNIGPVALLQDLAVAATLGITSVERNGHHYFAGLSAFPQTVHDQVLEAHPDLYHRTAAGWPALRLAGGRLQLASINAAPFGVGFELDVERYSSVDSWRRDRRE